MKKIFVQPLFLVVLVGAGFLLQVVVPGDLHWLGIRPRSISGLLGIFFSPFLHSDLRHLISNVVPLLIMGGFVSALAPTLFLERSVILILASGLLTWLISSSGVVIGASSLVFAYWAFLITNGLLNKRVKDVSIALITFLLYGALIFSLFRFQYGVSWAGHFSGAMAGAALAYITLKKQRKHEN